MPILISQATTYFPGNHGTRSNFDKQKAIAMSLHLPRPIELFMSSENNHDTGALEACFTLNATVRDEGRTREGLQDISAWRRETAKKYQHTVTPIAIAERKGKTIVTAKLTGNFPGSPVTLDFVFQLEGDRITSLEIQSQAAI